MKKKNNTFLIGVIITIIIGGIILYSVLPVIKPGPRQHLLTLEIKGLVCAACVKTIENSLQNTPGVKEVSVDLNTGKATLTYNDGIISREDILNHRIFSGFYKAEFVSDQTIGKAEAESEREEIKLADDYLRALEPLQEAEALTLTALRKKEGLKEILDLLSEVEVNGLEIEKGTPENNLKRINLMLSLSSIITVLEGITPEDYLYPLKRKAEVVRFNLSPTPIYQAKNQFLMADNRINELGLFRGTSKLNENLVELSGNYRASMDNVLKFVAKARELGKEKKKFIKFAELVLVEVNEALPSHLEILEDVYGDNIPEDILASLDGISKASDKTTNIFQVEDEEIPLFLNFIKEKGWYAHKVIDVQEENKIVIIEDGIGHTFQLTFDFTETHLREHHGLDSYIDDMGLVNFLDFVIETGLYQHRIDTIIPEEKVAVIKGDEGTDFETTFNMTFENIIKHMRLDHKWTNQELLDANYCQETFQGEEVDNCIKKLTEY